MSDTLVIRPELRELMRIVERAWAPLEAILDEEGVPVANLSNYAENKLLDHLLGTLAFTMPAQVYLHLYTSDPTDADTGTEVANAGAYASVAIDFDAAVNGAADLTADAVFPTATADWGTVTHVGLRDAAGHAAGNLLMHGALAASRQIQTGDTFRIPAADLDAALT